MVVDLDSTHIAYYTQPHKTKPNHTKPNQISTLKKVFLSDYPPISLPPWGVKDDFFAFIIMVYGLFIPKKYFGGVVWTYKGS